MLGQPLPGERVGFLGLEPSFHPVGCHPHTSPLDSFPTTSDESLVLPPWPGARSKAGLNLRLFMVLHLIAFDAVTCLKNTVQGRSATAVLCATSPQGGHLVLCALWAELPTLGAHPPIPRRAPQSLCSRHVYGNACAMVACHELFVRGGMYMGSTHVHGPSSGLGGSCHHGWLCYVGTW